MIIVPERGHRELAPDEWEGLSRSAAFWQLVTGNVIKVAMLPGGQARLDGTSLVGRAICDGLVVECQEKIEGALAALLVTGTSAFKTRPTPAPLTELGPMIALLIHTFVEEVRNYVRAGREWRYESKRFVSSRPAGKLHVPTTVQLRARGLRHLVAFNRQEISHATPMNRLLYAALREVEVLARLAPVQDRTLSTARAMSLFFEDCRDAEVLFGSSVALAKAVESLRREREEDEYDQMLALTGIILSHNSFEASQMIPGVVPFSWFLNLEALFEQAVRRRLRALVTRDTEIYAGRSVNRTVFPAVGLQRAEPDLVLGTVPQIVVGDVKYKDWSGSADASDIYQLLVHARAFDADRNFLVFPSDHYEEVHLGLAVTGAATWLFAVDVRDLDSGLRALCNTMAITTR